MPDEPPRISRQEKPKSPENLKEHAKIICDHIEYLIKRQEVVSENLVNYLLRLLDKILAIDPDYPVYEFLPCLNTKIILGSNEANLILSREATKSYHEEICTSLGIDPELPKYHYLQGIVTDQKLHIQRYILSVCQSIFPLNNGLLVELLHAVKLEKSSRLLDFHPSFYKLLAGLNPNFSKYTRIYQFKLENKVKKGSEEIDLEEYTLSECNNVQTFWGHYNLTRYTKNHQGEFLKTKHRVTLDYTTKGVIKKLLDDLAVVLGNAPDNFLNEFTLSQEDLKSATTLHYINWWLLAEPGPNGITFKAKGFYRKRYEICAGFFRGVKIDIKNVNNPDLIEILNKIKQIDPELYQSMII